MGASWSKEKTLKLKGKPQPSNTEKSFRNLPKKDLGGVIFACKHNTMAECYSKLLFGLPGSHFAYVKNISPGMPLFLFNYSDRKLHGIFEADSPGQMNIDPYAWVGDGPDGAASTLYPAQARVRIKQQCQSLEEDQYRPIIADNYFKKRLFCQELDKTQTKNLISLFSLSPVDVSARDDMAGANTSPLIPDVEHNTLGASSSTSNQPKISWSIFETWTRSSLLKHSTSTELFNGDEAKTQMSDLNFGAAESNEEQTHAGSESGGDTASGTTPMNGEIPHLEDSMHADVKKDGVKVYEEEVSGNSYYSADNYGEASDAVDSESAYSSALAVADMEFVVDKLLRPEIGGLKDSQLEQDQKICILERELDESRAEVHDLKNRCDQLESRLLPRIWDVQETVRNLDGAIHLVGGLDGCSRSWLSALDSYSPSQDMVKSLKPMMSLRTYASAATLDGELYLIGGMHAPGTIGGGPDGRRLHTVESYNPVNDQWDCRPPLNQKRAYLAGASLNGKIYAIGGENGRECYAEVEMLDMNIGRWITTRSMLEKRYALGAAEINGSLYVAGGYDGRKYLNSVERFDPREKSWTSVAGMSKARGGHSVAMVNEKLYALGGYACGYNDEGTTATVEIFDPRVGIWYEGVPMNYARENFGAVAIGEIVFAIGGQAFNGLRFLDTVECYKERCAWEVTNLKAVGKRCNFSAVVLPFHFSSHSTG